MSLEELGLRSNQLRVLRDAGFNTLESICAATIAELENVKGISGETAHRVWKKAQEALIPQQYIPASKLMLEREKNIQQLTTRSKAEEEISEKMGSLSKRGKRIQITFRISPLAKERLEQAARLFMMKPAQYAKAVLYRDLGLFQEPIDRRRTRWSRRPGTRTWERDRQNDLEL